jgi:voltage-gated potassium channel
LAALTIEKLNPGIHTCVELLNRANGRVLEMVGVEEILVGDEYMGNVIAHATRTAGLVRALDELLRANVGNQFYRIPVPESLADRRLDEALIRLKHDRNLLILGVEQGAVVPPEAGTATPEKPRLQLNPPPDLVLHATDHLLVIGNEA